MNLNDYYVYEYIRLDTNEPFYVGKGKGDRWKYLNRDYNKHFMNIVKTIPIVVNVLHDNLDENIANGLEVYYIWLYRDVIGYDLCNIADGGEGCALVGKRNGMYNKNHSEESKKKMSENRKGKCCGKDNPNYGKDMSGKNAPSYGKHLSEETKQKISKSHKGMKYSDETKIKLSKIRKGRKMSKEFGEKVSERMKGENNPNYGINPRNRWSEETKERVSKEHSEKFKGKNNPRAKSIICLTTKRIFFTVTEGANYYKVSRKNIINCCKGFFIKNNKKYNTNYAGKLPNGTKLVWRYLKWNHDKKYRIKR